MACCARVQRCSTISRASILELAVDVERLEFMGDFGNDEVRSRLESLKASPGVNILKTHEAPLESAFYDENVRVLFSYRDVRDIAASMKKKWGYPFEQILAEIDAMIEIERAFSDIPNVLVQSYDMLYKDLPAAIGEIARFLAVPIDEVEIARLAAENSVETFQKRIESRSKQPLIRLLSRVSGRFRIDPKTQMHDNHISAAGGKDGDWTIVFSTEEIATLLNQYAGWLETHQYDVGPTR